MTQGRTRHRTPARSLWLAAVAITALAVGLVGLALGTWGSEPKASEAGVSSPSSSTSTRVGGERRADQRAASVRTMVRSAPTRVRIPAIGVDSAIIDIGVDRAGVLIPPATTDITGWFSAGPVPGTVGPALLAGHVDSRAGPGVFFRLGSLRPGDEVVVARADGSTVAFTVESTVRVAKVAFPTELVYSPLPVPMLRLITCGGEFDNDARSYRDNIIVDAVLT